MRNRKTILALCLTASFLLSSSASAGSLPDLSPWAAPNNVSLDVSNKADVFLDTNAELSYSSEQLRGFPVKGQLGIGRFFPSLIYRADATNELQPQVMMSNLPGAKFFRTAADKDGGEQIKVSVLGAAYLQADKTYEFSTGWRYTGTGDGNPFVTLSSLQEFDQGVGGTITEQSETERGLAVARWKEAKPSQSQRASNAAALFKKDPFFFPREDDEDVVKYQWLKGYSTIDSKKALDQYKSDAAKLLKAAPDCCSLIRFAITFKGYVDVGEAQRLAKEYKLNVTQYYAAGKKEKQERDVYTVSWFDPKWERPLLLINRGFYSFQVTELEGTARGDDLKRISSIEKVDVVDIEDRGKLPTGIYWLNQRFSESE